MPGVTAVDLCVLAAQEAVKEAFDVPWSKARTSAPPPPPKSESAVPASDSSDSGPSKPPVAETLPSTDEPAAKPPADEKPVPVPVSGSVPEASGEREEPSCVLVDSSAPSPVPTLLDSQPASSSSSSPSPSSSAPPPASPAIASAPTEESAPSQSAAPSMPVDEPSPVASTSSAPRKPTPLPTRILTQAHFDVALKNSSSSGSELLGALPDLRKVSAPSGPLDFDARR